MTCPLLGYKELWEYSSQDKKPSSETFQLVWLSARFGLHGLQSEFPGKKNQVTMMAKHPLRP